MLNYYKVLEIPDFSSEIAIKKAYRSLSKKYHPDLNKDPFAHNYFLKINEAYDFLMNENKRLLLNQYLHSFQQQKQNNQQKFNNTIQAPVLHTFYCDRKTFSLNDQIFIKWDVSNCKSVSINLFGNVAFQGSQYYEMHTFLEILRIELKMIGFDDKVYTSVIDLHYFNEIPGRKAYHQMLSKKPKTKEIHFKQEQFFHTHARISRLTFVNRFALLSIAFFFTVLAFLNATYPQFLFIVLCALLATIWVQCVKRLHDLALHKNSLASLILPFYNFKIIKDLFTVDSEKGSNEFGVYPNQEKLQFKDWVLFHVKKINETLNMLQKVAVGLYVLLLLVIGLQSIRAYDEYEVALTNQHIETSRPNANGSVSKYYYVQFNNVHWVEVTEKEFEAIVYHKIYNNFFAGVNNDNEIKYVKGVNNKGGLKTSSKFAVGELSNANPAIIILSLMFLGVIYVVTQFTKADEKFYGNVYLVFTILVYVITIMAYIA